MKHLRLDVFGEINEHPIETIKKLGITYQHATPQSICDQWWFWNCEKIPNELPSYLSILNLDPLDQIGYGLSKKDAIKIRDYKKARQ